MKITVEAEGYRIVIDEEDLDDFALSMPSDIRTDAEGLREMGRVHISLTGIFKEGFRPRWEAVDGD